MSARDAHANLGASSAYRWMSCPGSPREIAALPDTERGRDSRYARQGSAAHFLAESCIEKATRADEFLDFAISKSTGQWELIRPRAVEEDASEDDFVVDEDMANAVQVYLDEIARIRASLPMAVEMVERRVYPLPDRPEMFGTLDYSAYDPIENRLHVIDYKHGAGVFVEAEHNPQTAYYALGALREVGFENVEELEITIVQPRAFGKAAVRAWNPSPREILEWGDTLRAAAEATEDPKAKLHAGSWCGFCPAASRCPALLAKIATEAGADFDDPTSALPVPSDNLEAAAAEANAPEKLARALDFIPLLDAWAREVEGYAQRLLERGGVIPGYKIVRKRGRRQWVNPPELEREIREYVKTNAGLVKQADFYEKKLRSPAQIEKIKSVGKDWVKDRCEKTEGGVTIARESDPRPALPPPAIADFANADDVMGIAAGTAPDDDLLS